jgi:uncharacterized membrane protein HdeD (DUF308 family)
MKIDYDKQYFGYPMRMYLGVLLIVIGVVNLSIVFSSKIILLEFVCGIIGLVCLLDGINLYVRGLRR